MAQSQPAIRNSDCFQNHGMHFFRRKHDPSRRNAGRTWFDQFFDRLHSHLSRQPGDLLPNPVSFAFDLFTNRLQQLLSERKRLLPLAPHDRCFGIANRCSGGQCPVSMQEERRGAAVGNGLTSGLLQPVQGRLTKFIQFRSTRDCSFRPEHFHQAASQPIPVEGDAAAIVVQLAEPWCDLERTQDRRRRNRTSKQSRGNGCGTAEKRHGELMLLVTFRKRLNAELSQLFVELAGDFALGIAEVSSQDQ